jgi:hypothetical protein
MQAELEKSKQCSPDSHRRSALNDLANIAEDAYGRGDSPDRIFEILAERSASRLLLGRVEERDLLRAVRNLDSFYNWEPIEMTKASSTKPAPYEFHPLANNYPLMTGQAYEDFKASIKESGRIRIPVVLHEGKILDGRNRYHAGMELELEFPSATSTQRRMATTRRSSSSA